MNKDIGTIGGLCIVDWLALLSFFPRYSHLVVYDVHHVLYTQTRDSHSSILYPSWFLIVLRRWTWMEDVVSCCGCYVESFSRDKHFLFLVLINRSFNPIHLIASFWLLLPLPLCLYTIVDWKTGRREEKILQYIIYLLSFLSRRYMILGPTDRGVLRNEEGNVERVILNRDCKSLLII